jgi:MSHA biogenesis protein MshP
MQGKILSFSLYFRQKFNTGFTKSRILHPESCQKGFAIISAIFLLVVIAALGIFAVTISTTQQQSQTMDVMGARGYQAALAGVDWAAYHVNLEAASSVAPWGGCIAGATVSVTDNLTPFSPVTVNCNATSAVEGTSTIWIYDVSATARTGTFGDMNYVEQVATAKLAK